MSFNEQNSNFNKPKWGKDSLGNTRRDWISMRINLSWLHNKIWDLISCWGPKRRKFKILKITREISKIDCLLSKRFRTSLIRSIGEFNLIKSKLESAIRNILDYKLKIIGTKFCLKKLNNMNAYLIVQQMKCKEWIPS